jgi:AraC-like DNA-binding protein
MQRPVIVCERPVMSDTLEDVITLLQPQAVHAKCINGAGRWGVHYAEFGQPGFCTVLEGTCLLTLHGHEPVSLQRGDFVLLPQTPRFTLGSHQHAQPMHVDPKTAAIERGTRYGEKDAPIDVRLLGGFFTFVSSDAALIVSLLPPIIHLKAAPLASTLIGLIDAEAQTSRPGRELILRRFVEVLLAEAIRSTSQEDAPPGLMRGLADNRISLAIQRIHGDPARAWTVPQLAAEASLSRSAFFERFTKSVGLAPMEYLFSWRMAVAKNLLRRRELAISAIAEQVGYGSASTFTTAFRRYVGQSPGRYARETQ